jgi:hypothetical protein
MKVTDEQVIQFASDLPDLCLSSLTEITQAGMGADVLARVLAEPSPNQVQVSAFQSAM